MPASRSRSRHPPRPRAWRSRPRNRPTPPRRRVQTATVRSPRASSRRPVVGLGWAAGAAVVALCFAISPNYDWYPERTAPYAGDFVHQYVAGWVVRTGDPARVYDLGYITTVQHDPALTGFTWPADQFFQ